MQNNQQINFLELSQPQQLKQLLLLLNQKRLADFIKKCQLLINKGVQLSKLSSQFMPQFQLQYHYLQMKRIYYSCLQLLQKSRLKDEGWRNIQADQRCQMSLKLTNTILQLKSKGTILCNIKNIFVMAYLIKLYNQCLPFCKQAVQICQPTKLQKVGMINMSFPIPFVKDRCLYIRGLGIDMLKESGVVCIYAQGINDNEQFLDKYKINAKEVMKRRQKLDLKHFVIELKYVDNKTTEYCGYAKIDHHLSLVPQAVILLIAKQMGVFLFKKLMKKLMNFESTVWHKEIKQKYQENADFYDWLNKKVQQQMVSRKNHPKF